MREVEVPSGWGHKLEMLSGTRRDTALLVGVVLVVALAALLLWSRRAPASIAPPAQVPSPGASGGMPSPAATILVHVSGRVRRPGLYGLAAGTRVADAIAVAGGARRSRDLDLLNLAELLQDGQKVHVGAAGTGGVAASATGSPIVSLNRADAAALETIPGIGPAKAAAILTERGRRGAFAAIEDLLDVQGIGPATLEAIRPYVTL